MARKAYVLIETSAGIARQITSNLKQQKGVKSAFMVTGPYDVIAIIEGKSLEDLSNLITSKINTFPGISRTVVCFNL